MDDEKKKVILTVDDRVENLQLAQNALGDEYAVRIAKSPLIALRALDNNMLPDLILLDIEMPGMNGFELLEKIRAKKHLSAVPVIFVTSHATSDMVRQAACYGICDYIAKPYDAYLLREKVKKAFTEQINCESTEY